MATSSIKSDLVPETALCPYCGMHKVTLEFTDEHVVPRALGGGLEGTNPFKLRVCKPCNSACGSYVDGPVARSPFIKLAHSGVVDLAVDPILPPLYCGRLIDWIDTDTVCDFWLGPTGDQIFHFHAPYPDADTMVGGASWVKSRTLDPGTVFVGVVATNPEWYPIIARSVQAQFKRAPIYTLNSVLLDSSGVPKNLLRHLDWIRQLPLERRTEGSVDLHCGERFTAKLALGLGAITLGEQFIVSPDASKLREMLWGRDPLARASIPIRGRSLQGLPQNDELVKNFGWRKCHTLALLPIADSLALIAVFYGSHALAIEITAERRLWAERLHPRGGVAWIIAPGLRRFAGPMLVPEMFIDMRQDTPTGPLAKLGERLLSATPLPPHQLSEHTEPRR